MHAHAIEDFVKNGQTSFNNVTFTDPRSFVDALYKHERDTMFRRQHVETELNAWGIQNGLGHIDLENKSKFHHPLVFKVALEYIKTGQGPFLSTVMTVTKSRVSRSLYEIVIT